MSPSRRALLRAGLLGLGGSLAGCIGREETTPTESTASVTTTEQTTRTTTETRTTETRTADAKRPAAETAVEFVHRESAFGRGVSDAGTWYYAHVLDGGSEADRLDTSKVHDDVAGQSPEAVERFVAETDFETTAVLAVQAKLSSPARGLEFGFLNREVSPPRIVTFVRNRDRADAEPVVSTLLVRVPAADAPRLGVTVVESDLAYERRVHPVVTFEPPNDSLLESVRVRGHDRAGDRLPDPGGALVTGPEDARRFAPTEAVFSEFVRETEFDQSYLLAVRLSFDALDYVWPQSVARDRHRVTADVRQYDPRMGLNPVYSSLTLTRIPAASPPDRGTATLRRYPERRPNTAVETRTVPLSADPDDWRTPTPATTRTGNRT